MHVIVDCQVSGVYLGQLLSKNCFVLFSTKKGFAKKTFYCQNALFISNIRNFTNFPGDDPQQKGKGGEEVEKAGKDEGEILLKGLIV